MTHDNTRNGHCYVLAYRYMFKHDDCTLIHAEVYSHILKRMIDHAFVELECGCMTYEPVLNAYFEKEHLYVTYKVKELKRYTVEEACIAALKHETYGPWEDNNKKGGTQ